MANPFFQWKVEKHANGDRSPFGQVLRPLLSCLMMRVDGRASVRVLQDAVVFLSREMLWVDMDVNVREIG